jgi:F-type H+-transporting ATPase subunit epsilon
MYFDLKVISPEKLLFEGEVSMVVVPGILGDLAILPKHTALMTPLRSGVITIHQDDKILESIEVKDNAMLQIDGDDKVLILT